MKFKSTIAFFSVAALMAACNNRVSVSETGLKYQIHDEHSDSRKPKVGDILTFHLVLKNSKDSVLRDTYKEGQPMQMMLQVPPFKGSFEEGLAMISKQDSASFFVSADSLFTRMMQPLPPGIPKGSDIQFTVKLVDVQNEQEFQKSQASAREKQVKTDAKIIDDYVAKNKLNATETASGLNYVVTQEGTGVKPVAGNVVTVHYTGKLLDGKVFDSSVKNPQSGGKPIDFPIGQGMVIPGWEEGIMTMKKGGKCTFIIPSSLAYGTAGSPGVIPPNSVLVFDVELVDVKKAPAAPAGPGAVGGQQ
ncbi:MULTISPECIES: FKBP-type peptidyl-prolyl cis-trans isomerase [Runella]|uniref:Peptidyl-prolyl cis-trans isomerase n=1 Tax=Runella defluvii TaxID=370973 RepID=A0A7W5ZM29_9BACT|nr:MULTISPECIES: FKBP-type peptidyl-prolyl cis-trans isomerase [Runella]AYQ35581.1 peptidylprolyl isomerase [Runella sp. SP2]MBB3839378.1 FKBP-type peptidyl-prolyl cis-trans isomerase [Runella defluvii]MCA0228957.1 FKBP-type peptidyl-prolyl cis-trans isomerase [Bacteroidota bacterium]